MVSSDLIRYSKGISKYVRMNGGLYVKVIFDGSTFKREYCVDVKYTKSVRERRTFAVIYPFECKVVDIQKTTR